MIFNYNDLLECFKKKGWTQSRKRDSNFKAGYPILLFGNRHPMIAVGFEKDKTIYCGHRDDECYGKINDSELIFLYKNK